MFVKHPKTRPRAMALDVELLHPFHNPTHQLRTRGVYVYNHSLHVSECSKLYYTMCIVCFRCFDSINRVRDPELL